MPNIKSSERSVKTDAIRNARNAAMKSTIKTYTRRFEESLTAGKTEEAKLLFMKATSAIDKAATKGVIHKNAAARKKSRLAVKLNQVAMAK